jgi:DNA anti-recombination protein RmuC
MAAEDPTLSRDPSGEAESELVEAYKETLSSLTQNSQLDSESEPDSETETDIESDSETETDIESDSEPSGPTADFFAQPDSDGDYLESAIQTLVAALRHEFARQRSKEHARLKDAYRQQIKRLEIEANQRVKKQLKSSRHKDRAKIQEREQQLHDLLAKLGLLAREIGQQKKLLKKSREEFEQKLMESDFVQNELRHIGQQLGEQVDSLGDSLLDEEFMDNIEQDRKFA